jgi:hypothetical protein
MTPKRQRVEEHVGFRAPNPASGRVRESADNLPLVIFSEIHAITANWITRNYTYYPMESLIGNPNEGSGVISFVNPYPVPIIRDHISSPGGGFFGPETFSCEPFGRVYNCNFVQEKNGGGWVQAVSAITDPYAISRVLDGRFMTMSIGGDVTAVYCSVCAAQGNRTNMVETGPCEHIKGQTYEGMLTYWMMGPLFAREISFVNQPSDVNARVSTPNMETYDARTLLAGTDGEFLLDMGSNSYESAESYRANQLGISRRAYSQIIIKAQKQKALYESLGGHCFTKHLSDPGFLSAVKANMKGL